MRNFVLIFLFLYSISSWAALSEISISGYASPTGDNTTSMKIYAGRAGGTGDCNTNDYSDTPCNTCAAVTTLCSGTVACNEKAVLPNTLLVVSFKTNSTTAINSAAAKISIGSGTTIANAYSQTDFTAATATNNFANQTLTAAFKWSDICQLGAGDQDCEMNISAKSLKVGISDGTTMSAESFALEVNFKYFDSLAVPAYHKNCGIGGEDPNQYDGACGLALTPGDNKVYVSEVYLPLTVSGSTINSWNSSGTDVPEMKYSGIRLYYTQATTNLASDSTAMPANTDWCNINLSSASTYRADVDIAADGTIASRKVEGGLENDKTYVFVMASIDKGGNVTGFSDPTPGNPWSLNTYGKHYATPGEVVGLLDGKKCFIATAAFGSEMAPQVEMLREFRNLYLLKSDWGKSFVRFYYSVSPNLAEGISESPALKSIVRTFLWPLVWFANLSINYGILLSLLLVSILSVALGFLIKKILVQVKQK